MVEQRPAIDVMRQHDSDETLHFVDPPYLASTRKLSGGRACYRHEMTDEQHVELLVAVQSLRGMVVLSGYPSQLYDDALSSWARHETRARISAGRGTGIRTECVWINPKCAAALQRTDSGLFAANGGG